jgi:hypothetical protein
MPWGLTRYQHTGQSHFVTFCCYHRHSLFTSDASRRVFKSALERVRRSFGLRVYGYVVMPEHIHLLVSEPERTAPPVYPLKPKAGLNGPLRPIACFPSRCPVITFTEFSAIFCEPRLATTCGWPPRTSSPMGALFWAPRESQNPRPKLARSASLGWGTLELILIFDKLIGGRCPASRFQWRGAGWAERG